MLNISFCSATVRAILSVTPTITVGNGWGRISIVSISLAECKLIVAVVIASYLPLVGIWYFGWAASGSLTDF